MRSNVLFTIAAFCTLAQIVVTVLFEVPADLAAALLALLLGALGALFIYWPMFVLRKFGNPPAGSSTMPTSTMVDRGPFAVVRHPQYLGYILINLTFILSNPHWLGALFGAAAVAAFYLLAHLEDKRLQETFGADYLAYKLRVPGINPVLHLLHLFDK